MFFLVVFFGGVVVLYHNHFQNLPKKMFQAKYSLETHVIPKKA